MTWLTGSPNTPPLYLLLRKSPKNPWLDRSDCLSTGILLFIWVNVNYFFWINSHQIYLYVRLFLFNRTPTFLEVSLFFPKHALKPKFFPRLRALSRLSAFSCGPPKSPDLFFAKLFFNPWLSMFRPDDYLFSALPRWIAFIEWPVAASPPAYLVLPYSSSHL